MCWYTASLAVIGIGLTLGLGSPAQAGAAMFQASLVLHAFGNDLTSGPSFPYDTNTFYAIPFGYDCYNYRRTPWGQNWGKKTPPRPLYCPQSIFQKGHPATGAGVLVEGTGATPSIQLPQSAVRVMTTGYLRTYGYTAFRSTSYATFVNGAGGFFAGGGPAATGKGRVTHVGESPFTGSWIIRRGKNGFGGPMGLLGKLGGTAYWGASIGGSSVTSSWNMIRALGRSTADPDRTFTNEATVRFQGSPDGTIIKVATGTPWTTGTVTVYASDSWTVLQRAGYDNRTSMGFGSIQLVTPSLTHWQWGLSSGTSGHIGILKIQIVPEPGATLLLAAGAGMLLLLQRVSRRR